MRVLLILSALLSAFSGMVGSRAQQQPAVSASIVGKPAQVSGVVVAQVVRRVGWASSVVASVVQVAGMPPLVFAPLPRRLWTERRRE